MADPDNPTNNRPPAYKQKSAGDLIRHGDWNEIQVRGREELHRHGHTGTWSEDGDFDGAPIGRSGIAESAIDGSKIDPDAAISASSLRITGSGPGRYPGGRCVAFAGRQGR